MWLHRLLRSQRGSQIVEFALIGPILLYLVLSIPVFGMFVRTWIVISAAARDGARAGALLYVGSRQATARARAAESVYLPHSGPGPVVGSKVYFNPTSDVDVQVDDSAATITVAVTYHQPSYLPLLAAILGGESSGQDTVPLTARATFLIEEGRGVP